MTKPQDSHQVSEIEFLDSLLESKSKYRKVVQAAISKWIKDFQDGHIKIDTVEDLRTLIQIDLDLQKGMRFDKSIQSSRLDSSKKHKE